MDAEVVVQKPNDAITLPSVDFNFDSTASSPYITAPNSPQRFGNFYFSAPTSPTRLKPSCFLHEDRTRNSVSSIPFGWESKPGIPKDKTVNSHHEKEEEDDDDDFEFDFSGQLDRASASADELFDGGKIKPLKPPPRLQYNPQDNPSGPSVVSPISPRSRSSPRKKAMQDFDPFAAALEQSTKTEETEQNTKLPRQRGRERKNGHSGSSSGSYVRKGTRSLSPLRVSDIVFEQEDRNTRAPLKSTATTSSSASSSSSSSSSSGSYFSSLLSSISFSKGYRKWSFKDFLLFRSASEGRGTSKDPLRKYSVLSRKEDILNDVKNSSFRSNDGSVGSSSRRGNVSAHELHYTVNRAVSEEMKKKTFLPYKQGLLGCLGFNPGVHEIARGVGSLTRG